MQDTILHRPVILRALALLPRGVCCAACYARLVPRSPANPQLTLGATIVPHATHAGTLLDAGLRVWERTRSFDKQL